MAEEQHASVRECSGTPEPALGLGFPDQPVMAERVCDAALAKTVRLVIDGEHLGGTRADRLSCRSIRIVHDQADANTRPAERLRTQLYASGFSSTT